MPDGRERLRCARRRATSRPFSPAPPPAPRRAGAPSPPRSGGLRALGGERRERGDEAAFVEPLESLTELAPGSWRGHYLLGELRRLSGNPSGAARPFEHSPALHPTRAADTS